MIHYNITLSLFVIYVHIVRKETQWENKDPYVLFINSIFQKCNIMRQALVIKQRVMAKICKIVM